jgi:hypothetical protein
MFLFLVVGGVLADDGEAKFTDAAANTAKGLRDKILAEVSGLKEHEWAGEYYAGDGLGVNTLLSVSPQFGYVFEWHGCLGVYDRNYGAVTLDKGRLQLAFSFPNVRKGFQGVAPAFVPVSWGSRHYLIPTDDVAGFCNQINQGTEPRMSVHGFYFLRRGDEKSVVAGAPKLPPEFQPYLLANPVETGIVTVGATTIHQGTGAVKYRKTAMTLDAGLSKGLREGMELIVSTPSDIFGSVRITRVEKDQSEAVMTQLGDDDPSPKAGWKLSTQAPWHAKGGK